MAISEAKFTIMCAIESFALSRFTLTQTHTMPSLMINIFIVFINKNVAHCLEMFRFPKQITTVKCVLRLLWFLNDAIIIISYIFISMRNGISSYSFVIHSWSQILYFLLPTISVSFSFLFCDLLLLFRQLCKSKIRYRFRQMARKHTYSTQALTWAVVKQSHTRAFVTPLKPNFHFQIKQKIYFADMFMSYVRED